ncbi:UNVERIFIED_CONTAM: hypothetical protein FKN15_000470 [Acipenser sinensis]
MGHRQDTPPTHSSSSDNGKQVTSKRKRHPFEIKRNKWSPLLVEEDTSGQFNNSVLFGKTENYRESYKTTKGALDRHCCCLKQNNVGRHGSAILKITLEQTLSSAVVQVYTADRNSVWSKRCCGVACLVKDNPQRSYFIRVYDIKDGKILWEQELYNNFSYNHSRSYFHTFAGDTLSSAVVQVYTADRNSVWSKRCCGVACLVKDNPQRSYFIRVYDIKDGKILWEQELYSNFSYNHSRSYFHTFAGDPGLHQNDGTYVTRTKRKWTYHCPFSEKRRDPPNGPVLSMATVDIKNPEINNMRFNNSQVNNIMPIHIKDKKKAKGKRKKLTKADIGTPSNFQHIGHVGWDPNTGFDLNNLDPELKNLFDMCGISEAQLKDKETSKAIYEFIEKKGGVEAVKNELRRQEAQLKDKETSKAIYEFIEKKGGVEAVKNELRRQGLGSGGPPPPPPPPPPPGPPPPGPPPPPGCALDGDQSPVGTKSAFLDQIREGAQLKKVEQSNRPVSSTGRDALLDQIRQGKQLKTVSDGPESAPSTPGPTAGIVGALMEVMQKRSKAIHSSDEDEDEDDEEDFEDDDEWDD